MGSRTGESWRMRTRSTATGNLLTLRGDCLNRVTVSQPSVRLLSAASASNKYPADGQADVRSSGRQDQW